MAFGTATVFTTVGKGIVTNRIKGSGTEPNYLAVGVGATGAGRTALISDSSLSSPVESRVAGTSSRVTTAVSNDTYQVVATTIVSAARAIDEAGLFDASTGTGMFVSSTFPVINLATGDSIQLTYKVQFT